MSNVSGDVTLYAEATKKSAPAKIEVTEVSFNPNGIYSEENPYISTQISVKVTDKDGNPVVWEACHTFSGSWGYHRDEASWKSKTVVTGVTRGNTHRFVYSTDGSLQNLSFEWGTVVTAVDTATIYYLGR